MTDLRPYQQILVDGARAEVLRGNRSVLMVAPTGAGKTVMAAWMVAKASARGKRTWFVVHRRELLHQSSRTFDAVGVSHGICAAGFSQCKSLAQICGVQSLLRRIDKMPAPDMIIWDEAHHIASESWSKIYSRFPDAVHLGVTATPTRLDGTGLRQWFSSMVTGPTTKSLIDDGMLAPFKMFAPSIPDMSGAKMRAGDFAHGDVEATMDRPSITGDAVAHYQRLCAGQRAIAFCASVAHSQHVVEAFKASGIAAAHLDGTTSKPDRDRLLADFKRGTVRVISNVDLFGEGFDVPAIEAAILLRPTQSLSLYLQQCGRALRTNPGKTYATILDHAGNCFRHGMPTDVREWSLDATPKTKLERAKPAEVRQCKFCFAAFPAALTQCPECSRFVETVAREIRAVEGTLAEITSAVKIEKRHEQGNAKTLEALVSIGRARKYKNPTAWANHVYQARKRG